jgi:hypothetical protein
MKKGIVILLLLIYSVSTIGATINMHYCMNQFAGWSLTSEKKEKCAKCGMRNTGCCKDEKKQIKLTLDQQKSSVNLAIAARLSVAENKIISFQINRFVSFNNNDTLPYLHAPPLISLKDMQVLYSTFLI